MIITVDSTQYTVDIERVFTPTYIQSTTFITGYNGNTQVSDRGLLRDKYLSKIKVIGDRADIEAIADSLYNETDTIDIDTQGKEIFGPAIDYSSPFTCLVKNKLSYPIRDLLTATIELTVQPRLFAYVAQPAYTDAPFYQFPIKRDVSKTRSTSDSIITGGTTNTSTLVNNSLDPIKTEISSFSLDMSRDELAKLQYFYGVTNRGATFTLDTDTSLELFLNSISTSVKITKFSFKPKNFKFWTVNMTVVRV